ncbi:MAG TPA: polysaccharide deacetylase family protein [Chloroflexota bacterium]|nr:polysaccharide deacetylase family protein [Chloroflexota bacterium]
MNPNPYLKKLGFSDTDRVVILHADDIGMCQAGLAAYAEIVEFGVLSSAAVMAPCPWFPATAVLYHSLRANRPNLDMGVHVTLTSEWANYRWGPISTRDVDSCLLDGDGYFPQTTAVVQANGRAAAVLAEMEAQLQRALAAGIDVTHLDSHMGTVFHAQFMPLYIELAQRYRIPALAFRWSAHELQAWGMDEATAVAFANWSQNLEASGFPLLDSLYMMPLHTHENRLEIARQWLNDLKPGIHYFLIHPAQDTPELRALAPDWRARVADYQLFISEAWRQTVAESGVRVIGWREIREIMRLGD